MNMQISKIPESKAIANTTPADLLAIAINKDADMDKLERLMQMQLSWEKNEARKAYVVAMNAFKADPPDIFKDKHVSYGEGKTSYDHASLGNVVKVIGESLANHGLSHRWNIEQIDGGMIKVTCVITHELGHSESVPLQAGADQSGGKNNIQAIGSTTTYLQRYTLLSATGLATKEMDDDGISSGERNQEQEAAILPEYPPEQFKKNIETWQNMISFGEKSAESIIATVSSRYVLSAEQIRIIKGEPNE